MSQILNKLKWVLWHSLVLESSPKTHDRTFSRKMCLIAISSFDRTLTTHHGRGRSWRLLLPIRLIWLHHWHQQFLDRRRRIDFGKWSKSFVKLKCCVATWVFLAATYLGKNLFVKISQKPRKIGTYMEKPWITSTIKLEFLIQYNSIFRNFRKM